MTTSKRGWPKGKLRRPRTNEEKAAISAGQKRRWASPVSRARAITGICTSYASGALAYRRVIWTPEMDTTLRSLCELYGYERLRTEGAKKIGVGDLTLRRRLKELGLSRRKYTASRLSSAAYSSRKKSLGAIYKELGLS